MQLVSLNNRVRMHRMPTHGPVIRDLSSRRQEVRVFAASKGSEDVKPATSPAPSASPAKPAESAPVDDKTDDKKPESGPDQTDERFDGIGKVLVTGATGATGRMVVEYLTSKGVNVVAMVRSMVKVDKLPKDNVTIIQGDVYQYADVQKAVAGVDAVICCHATNTFSDPLGPFSVDYNGTVNLVEAAKANNVSKFVLLSSIGTDGPILNPLNLFWGILFWKKRAEEHVQRSGLQYTIVRPGGLVGGGDKKKSGRSGSKRRTSKPRGTGPVVMSSAGTYGVPPNFKSGAIKRSKVAECCGEALVQETAANSVVEIISDESAPELSWDQLFEGACQ